MVVSPLKLLGTQFVEMLGDNRISAVSIMVANVTNELFEVCNSLINSLASHANI